ncbi:hypothetical protein QTJ16_004578 [Diplocarpon rosae]|uniref:Cleavage/polyadenylation specificity factor A subunit N-terminal domain-containing protein n=1 Tax=Diplocarpon rosae TaxID=946125 RepID=A0AAD9SYY1_9HELO|nr:hypothetical protein QTJ16_004578 [Diplocarpon rosae]
MALATSSLVDGEWVTRTLDVNTVLRHYNQQDEDAAATLTEVEKAPKLGLLTQTVIQSPLVHWILPIRLRDDKHHDVAFIGGDFVQIKELRSDGLLWDVIRKEDFGARIRNARVVGSVKAYENDPDVIARAQKIKAEDADEDSKMTDSSPKMASVPTQPPLPPQFLLLQLDTGDSVFLRINQSKDAKFGFISSRYRVSKPMLKLQPGMHLAVDPSSRYMAVGCSEGVFAIYSLHSRESLNEQYLKGSALRHVECETQVYPNGVILKMEFLHPMADDEEHIILLVIMVVKGRTKMFVYEWQTGGDLRKVVPQSSRGYLLETKRQMPLLLIPLTIKSSFILVFEDSMAVCQGILHSGPKFIDFNDRIDLPTVFHHGSGNPLWTAWTRPSRLESHKATRDDLFIAREDGLIKFLEIDSEDDDVVTADNNIGDFGANCGTALATMDYPNKNRKSGDLFIMGGDSCPGGTYLLQARQFPVLMEPIQNWSPAHDFVTTYNFEARETGSNANGNGLRYLVPKPDRIFACVGKGAKGGISELRRGYEANIGLHSDYGTPIMHAWPLSPRPHSSVEPIPYIFILSVGDRSGVLQMPADGSDIGELEENETTLDLNHRTIVAATDRQLVIQVTERSIVVTDGVMRRLHKVEDIPIHHEGESLGCGAAIDNATIEDGHVIFTTRLDTSNFLLILDIQSATGNMDIDSAARTLCQIPHEVTCVAAGQVAGDLCAIVAGWSHQGFATLMFRPATDSSSEEVAVPLVIGNRVGDLEAIISMVLLPAPSGVISLVCGTRNGVLLALEVDEATFGVVVTHTKRVGATPVLVSRDASGDLSRNELASRSQSTPCFMTCDSKAYVVTPRTTQLNKLAPGHHVHALDIEQIWLSDAASPGLSQPEVTSIARMEPLSGGTSGSLLFISGSRLLITGLSAQPRTVARRMNIGGTPNRLMYSQTLEILVVAASVNGKSSILFIDPVTGDDVSLPQDEKSRAPVDYISGLGNENERIFRLLEWSFTKDKKTWNYVIASTSTGRLLIISVHEENRTRQDSQLTGECPKRKICFFTRHKFKYHEPVYSATGLSEGLLWGGGTKLFYDVLDLSLKKFRRVAEYSLPSPAIDLSYKDGTIYALTSCHSLEILKMVPDDTGELRIVRTHGDQLARDALHHLVIDRPSQRPIHLVSDKLSSLAGLWPTYNTKADTLELVFEAALPSSILRFRFAQCRRVWDPVWTQPSHLTMNEIESRSVSNSIGSREALGLSISGSLTHFELLDYKTWRLMRLVIDLCTRSSAICEFTYKDDAMPLDMVTDPKIMMHIDGDILKRCVVHRKLEELFLIDNHTEQSRQLFRRFTELLQATHNWSLEKDAADSVYINQAYTDLEFYLRPVL